MCPAVVPRRFENGSHHVSPRMLFSRPELSIPVTLLPKSAHPQSLRYRSLRPLSASFGRASMWTQPSRIQGPIADNEDVPLGVVRVAENAMDGCILGFTRRRAERIIRAGFVIQPDPVAQMFGIGLEMAVLSVAAGLARADPAADASRGGGAEAEVSRRRPGRRRARCVRDLMGASSVSRAPVRLTS